MSDEDNKRIVAEYVNLQIRLETLVKQREEIIEKIDEIENTILSIEEIKENLDSLFSIGTGVYCKGKISEEKFFVNIGAGILLKISKKEAIDILRERIEVLRKFVTEIDEKISNIISKQEEIAKIINKGV
jgi:prefoldin alpha subunit